MDQVTIFLTVCYLLSLQKSIVWPAMCLHCDDTTRLQRSQWWMWHPKQRRPKERLSHNHIKLLSILKGTERSVNQKPPSTATFEVKKDKKSKASFSLTQNYLKCYLFSFLLRLLLPQSSLFTCVPTSQFTSQLHFPFREKKGKSSVGNVCFSKHPKPGTER